MSVTLRLRKTGRKGYTAYFDLYRKGKRQYEYPEIFLEADYLHPLKDSQGNSLRDAKGNFRFPKPTAQDRLKLELLEKIRLQRELRIKNEEYGFTDTRIKKINLLDYTEELYSETKISLYRTLHYHLTKCFGTKLLFGEVDERTVRKFLHYLSENTKLSINSKHTYFAGFSAVFNQAIRDKIIVQNPCKQLSPQERPKTEESKRTYLNREELTLLGSTPIDNNNDQIRKGFLFCCLTGLRISDVLKMKYSDIKDGVLQYRQQKSKGQFHYLPLSNQVMELIASLDKDPRGELVFWALKRNYSVSQRLLLLDRWIKSSGIQRKITWHVGRHTYATILLTFGEDIYTVSKLLGHSHVQVTERYGKIINQRKVEAVNKIPIVLPGKAF